MTNTNRIFKENYSIRPSTIFKKGWSLSTRKITENSYVVDIIVDTDSSPLTMTFNNDFAFFTSHEEVQSLVNNNTPFNISAEFRNELLATANKNKVLHYSIEDNQILATWNLEKSEKCFFVLDNDISRMERYASLEALEGKTVLEATTLIDGWSEEAFDDIIHGHSTSHFQTINDNCSKCGGGGCVHCSPKDFI